MPDPPLLPADPARRDAVLTAERWGDEELQETARWVMLRAGAARADCLIEGRPANRLADLSPDYPGHMPAGTIRVPA